MKTGKECLGNFFVIVFLLAIQVNCCLLKFFSIGKKRLMFSPCLSVCLSVSKFSREPRNTQNQNFQRRTVYAYAGNNPNLVHFRQCFAVHFNKKR